MFRQKTTIIVGAGASCEIGLPSGDGLKEHIMALLHRTRDNAYGFSDDNMRQIMQQLVGPQVFSLQDKLGPYHDAADRLLRGLPLAPSIDNFLHSHQDDQYVVQLGKLAIAICMLRAERKSHLFKQSHYLEAFSDRPSAPQMSIRGDELLSTWYPAFARLLMSGVQRNAIPQAFENIRFIIFNYDRCLEQFIWMALQDYFDIDGDEASEILKSVDFIHPYGSLGMLPWRSSNENSLLLGGGDAMDYWKVGARLKTFTESVRSQTGQNVSDAIENADTILILGFGYLDQNLQLLKPSSKKQAQRVLSTAYGISEPDQEIIKQAMMMLGNQPLEMSYVDPGTCRDLFDHFRLMLSLS